MNAITALSLAIMLAGAAISIGVFRRFGPVETPRGMRVLGGTVAVIGFLLGLTQSEPLPSSKVPVGARTPTAPAPSPSPSPSSAGR